MMPGGREGGGKEEGEDTSIVMPGGREGGVGRGRGYVYSDARR